MIIGPDDIVPSDWVEVRIPTAAINSAADVSHVDNLYWNRMEWLQERGVWRQDFFAKAMNDDSLTQDIFYIRDPDIAMLFKLTWGGDV